MADLRQVPRQRWNEADTGAALTGPLDHSAADPFVVQVSWLVSAAGGKDELVRRSDNRVSVRTLDNWTAGRYPRAKITGAVRDLDAWALQHMPGYPDGAGVPRLIDCCGPRRPAPAPPAAPVAVPDADQEQPAPRRRWLRWAVPVAALVVAVIALVVVLQVTGGDAAEALPTRGSGEPVPETTGGIGANTFADPVQLQDNAMGIPPDTTVQVRCRFYAPSIPSVEPDGFWYLIDSGKWAGRWAPANSFMNGDVAGQPTLHNTDYAVPVCS